MATDQGTSRAAMWPVLLIVAILVIAAPLAIWAFDREPGDDSVEAGFLRDMIVHHTQAVEMALIIRDRTDDQQMQFLATDILLSQQHQIGMMSGWLQLWDISPGVDGPHMAWMDHEVEGPMPGMASPEELQEMRTLPVDEAETLFLEAMIVHHQSAIDMAEAYLDRGDNDDVAGFARNVIAVQDLEIDTLNTMLGQQGEGGTRPGPGATPLASPVATPEHGG